MMTTQIYHDPFGRVSLMRDLIEIADREPCHWCGNRPGKFRYYAETDSGMTPVFYRLSSKFCCIDCYRSYHGRGLI